MAELSPQHEAALSLIARGLKVINVWMPSASGLSCQCYKKEKCTSIGKHPVGDEWEKRASSDQGQIDRWFSERPDWNIGVKFGKDSMLLDVEFDSPDAMKAYNRLAGEDAAACPAFKAHRGPHYLHAWQPGLPEQAVVLAYEDPLTGWRLAKTGKNGDPWAIEFRIGNGGGCQSVFPPSRHASGAVYEWLPGCSLDDINPPSLPPTVVEMLRNITAGKAAGGTAGGDRKPKSITEWRQIMKGADKGTRNVTAASYLGKLFSMIGDKVFVDADVSFVQANFEMWNSGLDEPLEESELDTIFASILKREREAACNRPTAEVYSQFAVPETPKNGKAKTEEKKNATVEAVPAKEASVDAAQPPEGWRMVIVKSDPRSFKLWSPFWEGPLLLSDKQVRSWSAIQLAALNKDATPPTDFRKKWLSKGDKKEGYFERLHSAAEHEAAMPEVQEMLIMADYLLDKIRDAQKLTERHAPGGGWESVDIARRIYQLPDGGAFVKVTDICNEWRRENGSAIPPRKVLDCLEHFGAKPHYPKLGSKQVHLHWLKPEDVDAMQKEINQAIRRGSRVYHHAESNGVARDVPESIQPKQEKQRGHGNERRGNNGTASANGQAEGQEAEQAEGRQGEEGQEPAGRQEAEQAEGREGQAQEGGRAEGQEADAD